MRFHPSIIFYKAPIKAAIVLSLLGASFLAVESYFNLQGTSLCKTAACEVVGNYLTIKEEILVASGSVFLWILTLILSFSLRHSEILKRPLLVLLSLALTFDGALIGFQTFSITQYCIICICTVVLLLVLMLLCCLAYREIGLLICILFAWTGAFVANGIMERNIASNNPDSMVLVGKNAIISSPDNNIPTVTFIFSMDCPHCMELISFIEESNYGVLNWRFASIDQDLDAIHKILAFGQRAPSSHNLFTLLKDVKNADLPSLNSQKSKSIDLIMKKNKATYSYLTNLNIGKIPVLIIQRSENEQIILTGSDRAKSYLHDLFEEYAQ